MFSRSEDGITGNTGTTELKSYIFSHASSMTKELDSCLGQHKRLGLEWDHIYIYFA